MDRKYRTVFILAAALCVVVAVYSVALSQPTGGVALFPEDAAGDKSVSFVTDGGVLVSAVLDANGTKGADASGTDAAETEKPEYTVNINTASAAELAALLPGIGEKKAAAIIEYRRITGGFHSVDELIEVDGIGEGLLERIRRYCVVE